MFNVLADSDWQSVLLDIWNTIVGWFEHATRWMDPYIGPIVTPWFTGVTDYFYSFPILLQVVFVILLLVLVIMGLFSLIKKSLKLVVVIGVIIIIFMLLNPQG